MKSLNPYLAFNGDCAEAMNYYKNILGGELNIQKFGDSPDPGPVETRDLVMHSELKVDNIHIMASDTMPGQKVDFGNNITLNISLTDEAEQTRIFDALVTGGRVTMPLQNTFWGARFGMLVDKFGNCWMLNCSQPNAAH